MHQERAGFGPLSRVAGTVEVPSSKSIAQRVLVCAALAAGRTRIVRLPRGEDVQHLLDALAGWGCAVSRPAPRAANIDGRAPGPGRGPFGRAHVGESGTAARLLTAAGALCGRAGAELVLDARGSLLRRTSAPLFAALRAAGARLENEGEGDGDGEGWPLRITPSGPPSELELVAPISSQEVSALLVALAAWPAEHLLRVRGPIPSRPYVELTRSVLADFGVRVESHPAASGEQAWLVRGPLRALEAPLAIEIDASAAAVALAAGCLSQGHVRVSGLSASSQQGDVAIVAHLATFGCEAGFDAEGAWARGAPLRGAELDLSATPDLAPVLAALAAAAAFEHGATSSLTGLATLPRKESSRIEVLARALVALGLAAEAGPDRLRIGPDQSHRAAVLLDPAGDHRMAFAFALLGLVRDGVWVQGPACVGKSWPTFWEDLGRAGAKAPGLAPPAGYPPRP